METIGRYRLIERIGEGGMGVVHRAVDTLLERTVALKVISSEIDSNPELKERFFREARAAAQLSHRNVVTIYDLGEHEGRPYLAMELLEGEDLQHRMAKKDRMSLGRKLDIAIQVCEALDFAHSHGIIHRDIKPANIFITSTGTVKLLDFGLARLVTSELTSTNMMMGTLNYMAPEQVRGERADQRSDIFSTGVVIYELLAGKKAFQADSVAATLFKILEGVPEPLRDIDASLPPEIIRIVERTIAKARDERYQSVGDLLRDLAIYRQQISLLDSPSVGRFAPGPAVSSDAVTAPPVPAASAVPPFAVPTMPLPHADIPATASSGITIAALAVAGLAIAAVAMLGGMLWFASSGKGTARDIPSATVTPPATQQTPSNVPTTPAPAETGTRAEPAPSKSEASGARPEATGGRTAAPPPRTRPSATHPPSATSAAEQKTAASSSGRPAEPERSAQVPAVTQPVAPIPAPSIPVPPPPTAPVPNPQPAPASTPTAQPSAAQPSAAPPPRSAEPVVVAPATPTNSGVREALKQYASALESRNIDALRRIWPSMTSAQQGAIQREFQQARQISVDIGSPKISLNGPTAIASFVRAYELQTIDGQRLRTSSKTTMTLRFGSNGWTIDRVTFEPAR